MATTDRVDKLLGVTARNRRVLVSPEGVPLELTIAGNGDRLSALAMDLAIIFAVALVLTLGGLVLFQSQASIGFTLMAFSAFIVQNLYFIYFELVWQGRTPGKRRAGLRVINRAGGELTPGAIVARNLTRQVEVFLPLSLWLGLPSGTSALGHLCLMGWVLILGSLPLWNRGRLRAGDLIGGTQVISMPRRLLLPDLSGDTARDEPYRFTPAQLNIYGAFELQVLEEFLRRPRSTVTDRGLYEVYVRIRRKIGWDGDVPEQDIRRWLTDFYTAERAELERAKLYGRFREDKNGSVTG